jgi:hypothetical protein
MMEAKRGTPSACFCVSDTTHPFGSVDISIELRSGSPDHRLSSTLDSGENVRDGVDGLDCQIGYEGCTPTVE